MKDKGYIRLYRSFFDNPLWKQEREYSPAEAWIHLLSTANFEEEKKRIDGIIVQVKRGQLIGSIRFLKEAWGWGSNGKVSRFLEELQAENMITVKTEHRISVITICNYERYNQVEKQNGTVTEQSRNSHGTVNGTVTEPKTEHQNTDESKHAEEERNSHGTVNGTVELLENSEKRNKNIENKEIRNIENNKGDGMPKGDTPPPEKEIESLETDPGPEDYILPAELKTEYVTVQRYVLTTKVLVKKRMITPFEYEKLRGDYTAEMILNMLPEMEDHKKMANHQTIYFTLLNWLKRDHGGNRDDQDMVEKYIEEYKIFVLRESGTEPRIDWKQKKAILELHSFFKERSKQKTPDAILKNWQYVLADESWKKLEAFHGNRIKATQILEDISIILKQINQNGAKAKPNSKAADNSKRKDF